MFLRRGSKRVREYKRIRRIGRELASQMLDVIPKEVPFRAARDMKILRKGTFVFDSEEEMSFLQDRIIYDVPWDGKNAIEHFEIERGPELLAEEKQVLEGMKKAYFSLFEVIGSTSGASIQLADLLSDSQIEIMDISMSRTARKGTVFAMRVVGVGDICMTSGAVYPFLPEQKDTLISGLKAQQTTRRSRKKRSARSIDFSNPRNYSLYFFRQYKKLSPVEVRMSEGIFE